MIRLFARSTSLQYFHYCPVQSREVAVWSCLTYQILVVQNWKLKVLAVMGLYVKRPRRSERALKLNPKYKA